MLANLHNPEKDKQYQAYAGQVSANCGRKGERWPLLPICRHTTYDSHLRSVLSSFLAGPTNVDAPRGRPWSQNTPLKGASKKHRLPHTGIIQRFQRKHNIQTLYYTEYTYTTNKTSLEPKQNKTIKLVQTSNRFYRRTPTRPRIAPRPACTASYAVQPRIPAEEAHHQSLYEATSRSQIPADVCGMCQDRDEKRPSKLRETAAQPRLRSSEAKMGTITNHLHRLATTRQCQSLGFSGAACSLVQADVLL